MRDSKVSYKVSENCNNNPANCNCPSSPPLSVSPAPNGNFKGKSLDFFMFGKKKEASSLECSAAIEDQSDSRKREDLQALKKVGIIASYCITALMNSAFLLYYGYIYPAISTTPTFKETFSVYWDTIYWCVLASITFLLIGGYISFRKELEKGKDHWLVIAYYTISWLIISQIPMFIHFLLYRVHFSRLLINGTCSINLQQYSHPFVYDKTLDNMGSPINGPVPNLAPHGILICSSILALPRDRTRHLFILNLTIFLTFSILGLGFEALWFNLPDLVIHCIFCQSVHLFAYILSSEKSLFLDLVKFREEHSLNSNQNLKEIIGKERRTQQTLKNFTAYLFHEVRVPLNAIVFAIDNLKYFFSTDLEGSLQRFPMLESTVNDLEVSALRAKLLLNEVLDYNSLEQGAVRIRSEWFSPYTSVRDVIRILNPIAINKNIRMEVHLSGDLLKDREGSFINPDDIKFQWDPTRYEQILSNILSNALKYTPVNGNVDIEVLFRNTENAELKESNHHMDLETAIKDNGIGMSKEKQNELFIPFTTLEENRSRLSFSNDKLKPSDAKIHGETQAKISSTGLGLYICKRIIDLSSGTIKVQSALGKGSEFRFTLTQPYMIRSPHHPNVNLERSSSVPIKSSSINDDIINSKGKFAATKAIIDGRIPFGSSSEIFNRIEEEQKALNKNLRSRGSREAVDSDVVL